VRAVHTYTVRISPMMRTRGRLIVLGALSLYLFVFGFACGMACALIPVVR